MAWINPFHQSLCPTCFEKFYLADCEIVSSINIDPNTNEHVVLREAPTGFERFIARFWLNPLSGPEYTQELATRRCPTGKHLLPHNIEYMDNRIIGLVGGSGAGKGHYIAALIHILQKGGLNYLGCTRFAPLNQKIDQRYQAVYYEPIFKRKEQLFKTQRAHVNTINHPLIYVMLFQDRLRPEVTKRLNLILFDAAGEDIADQHAMVRFSRYILNASALIFLVDPLTMPNIVEKLPAHLRPPLNSIRDGEALSIMNKIVGTYEQDKGLPPGATLPIPVSMTLAKSDLLRYVVENLGQQSAFLRDPIDSYGFPLADLQTVSQEVEELLNRFGSSALVHQSRASFANVNFCAVSATGGAPDPSGKFSAINPRRCLDPLLWILWQLGFINTAGQ